MPTGSYQTGHCGRSHEKAAGPADSAGEEEVEEVEGKPSHPAFNKQAVLVFPLFLFLLTACLLSSSFKDPPGFSTSPSCCLSEFSVLIFDLGICLNE